MTLRECLIRALVKNLLYGIIVVASLVAINANVDTQQEELPDYLSECWNPHTAQITIVVGQCPKPVNPYSSN